VEGSFSSEEKQILRRAEALLRMTTSKMKVCIADYSIALRGQGAACAFQNAALKRCLTL
jgi:hypothetical protein